MYSLFMNKHVCIDILALKENLNILKGIMDTLIYLVLVLILAAQETLLRIPHPFQRWYV